MIKPEEAKNPDELLDFIDSPISKGIHTYPNGDENNRGIFTQCLRLEKQGRIWRDIDRPEHVFWLPERRAVAFNDVRRITFRDGDVLVFRHPGTLPEKAYDVISRTAKNLFGGGVKFLILEEGMDIEVVSKDE